MRYIRGWIYRLGFEPKPGSIFYSPSKAWVIAFKKYDLVKAMEDGFREAEKWRNSTSTEKN